MALPDMLTNIAEFAVQAIPGADGAGLTLMEHDRPDTVVANADFVGEIDAIQYDLGEGTQGDRPMTDLGVQRLGPCVPRPQRSERVRPRSGDRS